MKKDDSTSSARPKPRLEWQTPVQYVKGVGPKLSSLLGSRGIRSVGDLLTYFPRAYQDHVSGVRLADIEVGKLCTLSLSVLDLRQIPLGRSGRKLYEVILSDGQSRIAAKFFRLPYLGYFQRFERGQKVLVIGRPLRYRGAIEFHHPQIKWSDETSHDRDRSVVPIYPEIMVLSSQKIQSLVKQAVEGLSHWPEDPLPERLRVALQLPEWAESVRALHEPPEAGAGEWNAFRTPWQKRLIFDEFFWLQLSLLFRKQSAITAASVVVPKEISWQNLVKDFLPFTLTAGQHQVIEEIIQDLARPQTMNRLLQGDVGSGKTIVALIVAYILIHLGYQVALMAPTEILAEQHFANAKKLWSSLGVTIELVVGSLSAKEKREVSQRLAVGSPCLVIGTHALIEDYLRLPKLALAIIDEQHRFGVRQRFELRKKNQGVHLLLMTATPIPRTVAMTLYGDLDVSWLRERPKNRKPILTRVSHESKRSAIHQFIREQLLAGRQAYVIYPLVEESEVMQLKNATVEYQRWQELFSDFKVGLLHGRMKAEEKDQIMRAFKNGQLHILVATSVIEVGIDVPNATVIMIEHAERFGLAALHQLRGRVGRGEHKSYCILMPSPFVSEQARERLAVMESTEDGFVIAEEDLRLRGPGEILGERQSGDLVLKMADWGRDREILYQAQEVVKDLLSKDPHLSHLEHRGLRAALDEYLRRSSWTLESG